MSEKDHLAQMAKEKKMLPYFESFSIFFLPRIQQMRTRCFSATCVTEATTSTVLAFRQSPTVTTISLGIFERDYSSRAMALLRVQLLRKLWL